jgi:hypothetical protein
MPFREDIDQVIPFDAGFSACVFLFLRSKLFPKALPIGAGLVNRLLHRRGLENHQSEQISIGLIRL